MKTPEIQILSMLQAFNQEDVIKAFELYKDENKIRKQLINDGWTATNQKPTNSEFYHIYNEYWIQLHKSKNERPRPKTVVKELLDLSISGLRCPTCGSKLYKQKLCPACKEGKQGFRIRLLCEENPDHEILL